jgi:hypothetical protein
MFVGPHICKDVFSLRCTILFIRGRREGITVELCELQRLLAGVRVELEELQGEYEKHFPVLFQHRASQSPERKVASEQTTEQASVKTGVTGLSLSREHNGLQVGSPPFIT